MNRQTGWNITIQQIHIFLQAMEMRNFTQVANTLNFTPSAVSKTIGTMEEDLGIDLFIRRPHELLPTPAAYLLADEWRQLVGSYDHSVDKALRLHEEQSMKINFGFVDSSAVIDHEIKELIRAYRVIHPEIRIVPEKHDMHRAVELIRFGMLDLAVTSRIEIPFLEENNLRWEKLHQTDVVAFVPSGNELFDRDSIGFDDLNGQPLVMLDPKMHPSYSIWLNRLCMEHGFAPKPGAHFRTVRSLMFSLELDHLIFIGESVNADWADNDLKMFTLPAKSDVILAYRKESSGNITDFRNFVMRQLGGGHSFRL